MSRPWLVAALAAVVLTPASSTFAQSARSDRPYRGLFAGDASAAPTAGHQLGVTGMLVSGYDDNLRAEARGNQAAAARGQSPSGSLTTATGMGAYSFISGALSISASGGGVARYYPSLEDQFVPYVMALGSASYSRGLWQGMTFAVSGTAFYRPYLFDSAQLFAMDGVPSGGAIGDADLPYVADSYLVHSEGLTLTQRLTQHTSLNALLTYRSARSNGEDDQFGRLSYGAQLSHTLAQGLSAHAGYIRRETLQSAAEINPLHVIDIGVDYNRALSFTRRTTLSFGTGSAAINHNDHLRFRITGNVQLTHEIGRTWTAHAAYYRNVIQSEVFVDPAEADGVSAGVSGLITRRTQLTFSARGVLGKSGVEQDAAGFDGVQTSLNVGYALNRSVNFTGVYAYYHHKFDDARQLAIDLPATVSRQSVRVGVTFWLPVFQSSRRTDASR